MWSESRNGNTKYSERYTDPLTLKVKKVTVTLPGSETARQKKLALSELQRKIEEKTSRGFAPSSRLDFLLGRYINYQRMTNRASTVKRNEATLTKCVKLIGEDVIVSNLTAAYIRDKFLQYTQNPVTLNEYIKRFKAMLHYAYDNDMITDPAVFEKLKKFKVDKQADDYIKPEDKYLEHDELVSVLDYMEHSQTYWWLLTRFLVLSGLRIGEAMALTVSDIGDDISVNKTYSLTTGEIHPPKTVCSVREVFVQPELAEVIKEIRKYNREMDLLHGCRSDLLFHRTDGSFIQYGAYNKYVRETTEKVIGSRRTPHAFRQTHESLLFGEGVSIDTISRRLGHEDSKITRKIYLHIVEKVKERDREILAGKRLIS